MILSIIFFSLLAFGILSLILPSKFTDWMPDVLCWIVVGSLFIGGGGTMAAIGTYAVEQSKTEYEKSYDNWDSRYRGLTARIGLWRQGTEDPKLWKEVDSYNEQLKDAKYWANNKWTNWWNDSACNEFPLITDIPTLEDIPIEARNKEE